MKRFFDHEICEIYESLGCCLRRLTTEGTEFTESLVLCVQELGLSAWVVRFLFC